MNFWTLKTKTTILKDFDAVELMRIIRTQIGKDIKGMSFEQEKEYFKKASAKTKKYQQVSNVHQNK